MKLLITIVVAVIFCPGSVVGAADYSFTWDANHVNDMVDEYQIYYRLESSEDYLGYEVVEVTDRTASPVFATITVPDVAGEYCFAVSAMDENGYESDKSNEDGKGEACKSIDDDDDGNSGGGGGGGGCFLKLIFNFEF